MRHKKLLIILLAVILLGTLLVSIFAGFFPKQKLSEMSDKRLIAFLKKAGLSTPEYLEGAVELFRAIIIEWENTSGTPIPGVSHTDIWALYEDLGEIVKSYYAE